MKGQYVAAFAFVNFLALIGILFTMTLQSRERHGIPHWANRKKALPGELSKAKNVSDTLRHSVPVFDEPLVNYMYAVQRESPRVFEQRDILLDDLPGTPEDSNAVQRDRPRVFEPRDILVDDLPNKAQKISHQQDITAFLVERIAWESNHKTCKPEMARLHKPARCGEWNSGINHDFCPIACPKTTSEVQRQCPGLSVHSSMENDNACVRGDISRVCMSVSSLSDVHVQYFSYDDLDFYSQKTPSVDERNLGFLSSFVSNCVGWRKDALQGLTTALTARKRTVHNYGNCLHNEDESGVQSTAVGRDARKNDIGKRHRYVFAFENSEKEGYTTEKLFYLLTAGAVPVYRGAPDVRKFLPSKNAAVVVDGSNSPEEIAAMLDQETEDVYHARLAWRNQPADIGWLSNMDLSVWHSTCRLCVHVRSMEIKPPTSGIWVRERGFLEFFRVDDHVWQKQTLAEILVEVSAVLESRLSEAERKTRPQGVGAVVRMYRAWDRQKCSLLNYDALRQLTEGSELEVVMENPGWSRRKHVFVQAHSKKDQDVQFHRIHKKQTFNIADTTIARAMQRYRNTSFLHTVSELMHPGQTKSTQLAVLILTCNRQTSLEALLDTLSHAQGIQDRPVYVSIDCNPGPILNLTLWHARGLTLKILESHQRHVIESGTAKARKDERVTRHWLHAVQTVLLKHEHVLYLEDDHLVHPAILHDAEVLLSAQPSMCPACFAVQLGCHRDCWGMKSTETTASDVARMEPGNMGVVYSRNMWQWFLQHLPEYCSMYGIWDVNLHHLLSVHPEHKHALTYLKSRVVHNSGCGSDRNTAGHAECDDGVLLQDQLTLVAKNMSMPSMLLDKGLAKMPTMKIHNLRAIQADNETKRRCIESTEVGLMPTQKHGSTITDTREVQLHVTQREIESRQKTQPVIHALIMFRIWPGDSFGMTQEHLLQWSRHLLHAGVSAIHYYDNCQDTSECLPDLCNNYDIPGTYQRYKHKSYYHDQRSMVADAISKYAGENIWFWQADVDEYPLLVKRDNDQNWMVAYFERMTHEYPQASQFSVQCVFFFGGPKASLSQSIPETYLYRAIKAEGTGVRIKSLFHSTMAKSHSANPMHRQDMVKGNTVDLDPEEIVFYHYWGNREKLDLSKQIKDTKMAEHMRRILPQKKTTEDKSIVPYHLSCEDHGKKKDGPFVLVQSSNPYHMKVHAIPDIVSSTIKSRGIWEQDTTHRMQRILNGRQEKSLVIDVGANIGFFTTFLASEGHRIIAVEPFGINIDCILSTVCRSDNAYMKDNVHLLKAALLDKGAQRMCLWSTNKEINNGNARLTPEFDGKRDWDQDKGVECMERIQSFTLDYLLFEAEEGPKLHERPMIMKMDIEGSETKALQGSTRLLQPDFAPCYIFFEFQKMATETTGVQAMDIFDLLTTAGYEIFDSNKERSHGAYTRATWGGVREGDFRAELLCSVNCSCRDARKSEKRQTLNFDIENTVIAKTLKLFKQKSKTMVSSGNRFSYLFFATSRDHVCAVKVMVARLKELGSQGADYVCVVQNKELLELFENSAIKAVIYVAEKEVAGNSYFRHAMMKMYAFQMYEYERVIFLDADSYVMKNLDHLFLLPDVEVAAPVANWENEFCITAALMVIKPSRKTWEDKIEKGIQIIAGKGGTEMTLMNELYQHRIKTNRILPELLVLPCKYLILSTEFTFPEPYHQSNEALWNETFVFHFSGGFGKPWSPSNVQGMNADTRKLYGMYKEKTTVCDSANELEVIPKTHAKNKVPLIFHFVWLSVNWGVPQSKPPARILTRIQDWKRLHPDWDIVLWTNDMVQRHFSDELVHVLQNIKTAAWASDIVRYHVVSRYGGVYLDTDIDALRPLPKELLHSPFTVCERPREDTVCTKACNAVIASTPENQEIARAASEALRVSKERVHNQPNAAYNVDLTGPVFWSYTALHSKSMIRTLPSRTFFPCDWMYPEDCKREFYVNDTNVYAMHVWEKSWAPGSAPPESMEESGMDWKNPWEQLQREPAQPEIAEKNGVAVKYTLQIFIPLSRIRVQLLCPLLGNINMIYENYHHAFDVIIYLVRTGIVTVETTKFWSEVTSSKKLLAACPDIESWNVNVPLIIMQTLPDQEPFPLPLQNFRPTATQHAEPNRMRQTWDYIQILHYAYTKHAEMQYTLVLEDDVELCHDFFPTLHMVLERPPSFAYAKQALPVFVGGFGASALGYPTEATAGLARFLKRRIRDSNLDVLISKALNPKSKWFAPVQLDNSEDRKASDVWMPVDSCVYKPSVFLVLHRGGKISNFESEHKENAAIVCGVADKSFFFVHEFSEHMVDLRLYRSCPM